MGIVTLLTDFGISDHFAAVVKGVILSAAPGTVLVDITHEVPPFCVRAGARLLEEAWRWFPPGTVNLAVVDPGVGTSRKALAARHADRWFVAPDNGLLGFLDPEKTRFFSLDRVDQFTSDPCPTFHGRDLFAPMAAYLSSGGDPLSICSCVDPAGLVRFRETCPFIEDGVAIGAGVHADRFGNIVTNLPGDFVLSGSNPIAMVEVRAGGKVTVAPAARCFGDAPFGSVIAVAGSCGRVEICVSGGRAVDIFGPPEGLEVRIRLSGGAR